VKGKGVSFLEDKLGWHGKTLDPEQTKRALAEIGDEPSRTFETPKPPKWRPPQPTARKVDLVAYTEPVATRKAYGDALAALSAARSDVVTLDAEVSNSTHAEEVKKVAPERFFEMYIAEQKMLAAAVGMQVIGFRPFASTFAAFFTRAYDFIRMAAISRANIRLSGSHAGVSIGEDGPSQMALEDLAMMRAVHGSTVLYPSEGNQTSKLVVQMADREGIVYLRTTRANTPILYGPGEEFPIGGSKVVRGGGSDDQVAVVAAGITLHESVKAAEALAKDGIKIRVIDLYSVKPIDTKTLVAAAGVAKGRLVVAEDHWPEGGLGEAVLSALTAAGVKNVTLRHLAPRDMPGSGKPAELLSAAGIDADHIARAVRDLIA
jgi:transketolase